MTKSSRNRFIRRLSDYLNDMLPANELDDLIRNIMDDTNDQQFKKIADEAFKDKKFSGLTDSKKYEEKFGKLINVARNYKDSTEDREVIPGLKKGRSLPLLTFIGIAAAITLVITIGSLWIAGIFDPGKELSRVAANNLIDLTPGGNKAMLTLSDGTTIVLDSTGNGFLAEQAGTQVVKVEDGLVAYTPEGRKKTEVVYNTVTTPRAGQYELILPDGSRVWLNSESSIKFPVSFIGSFRFVEITGEAFFEVAENPEMPFRVQTKGIIVEVLGTSFNVRAFADEGFVNTTLVEGSVQIASPVYLTTIAPGQMASADDSGQISVENDVDIDEIIAWKNGVFIFNSANIEQIMKQISRWYDVDVVFAGETSTETFSGIVSRKNNVSEVLKIMEQAGIKFSVTEEVITVELK
jgi:transmembrane sensor